MRRKSSTPTKTVEDLKAREEAFISGATADELEQTQPQPPATPVIESAKPKKTSTPRPKKTNTAPEEKDIDMHEAVQRGPWPLLETPSPSLADGRTDIDRPFVMRLKENLWLSVERHCKALGVDKSKWVREAMLKLMYEEQMYYQGKKKQ